MDSRFLEKKKGARFPKKVFLGPRDVLSGVPQDSVLGPLLFVLFVNDILEVVYGNLKMYADDSKLYNIQKNNESLQRDLDNLEQWCIYGY